MHSIKLREINLVKVGLCLWMRILSGFNDFVDSESRSQIRIQEQEKDENYRYSRNALSFFLEEMRRHYLPRLGEDTQNELVILPPSLSETTMDRTRESLDATQVTGIDTGTVIVINI
jgi:hypothetical protein